MVMFEMARNLFSVNRFEGVVISTVTIAALVGIRKFVKQYSVLISALVVALAVALSEYRMKVLTLTAGLLTLTKYEVSILVASLIAGYYGGRHLYRTVRATWTARKLKKFSKTPRDLVILHGFPRPRTLPNVSPFVLKVETCLRMGRIKYEYDSTEPYGPSGKAPWISVNGEHITDSEFIIDFLLKKFEKDLNNRYGREQLAVANCAKLVLEEHAIWGLSLEKFVFNKTTLIDPTLQMPFLVRLYMQYAIKNRSEAQGMGEHTPEEIEKLVKNDIRSVSYIMGENHFICGDRPCVYDCGIFGILCQIVYGKPDSKYKKLLEEECKNLEDYCVRMKEKFFPDWNDLLAK